MDEQIIQAVDIVFNPTNNAQELKQQAMEFLQQVKESPEGWQICLPLFTRSPKPSQVVRLFALDNVNAAIQNRYFHLNEQHLGYIRTTLMDYVRQEYTSGSNTADNAAIQNKLSQTMTYLFIMFYTSSWTSFFDELLSLTSSSGVDANGQSRRDSLPGVVFVLRMLVSIHDEIADQLLVRTNEEQKRNAAIKDFIRDQDVRKLVTSWQEILNQWRGVNDDVVEMTLKVIARWVSWIDISLVVNDNFLGLLMQFLRGENVQGGDRIRYAAIETLAEIAGKKMRGEDKLTLIEYLRLASVVSDLMKLPTLQDKHNYDPELAEAVAKLVNTIYTDLVKMLDTDPNSMTPEGRDKAEAALSTWLEPMLHFFGDEYDEVSITVLPSLSDLLTYFKKEKKNTNTIIHTHQAMLEPALKTIVQKMKYDETSSWGDEDDQTDEAEFIELRKRLKNLQDAIAVVDDVLYREALSRLVADIFQRLHQGSADWRDLDLALYEMYQFGEVAAKSGSIYQNHQPNGPAAEILVGMMAQMMDSGLSTYQHPAIKLLFMEISVRYASFFEHRKEYVIPALEAFVQSVHDTHVKVRRRSWYLFQRFVKILRNDIGAYADTVLSAISDLLVIKADLSNEGGGDDDDMSSDDGKTDATFESQLNLFEAVGALSSSNSVEPEKQRSFVHAVLTPIFSDMESNLGPAKSSNAQAILQIHHDIMAIGTLSKGLCDGHSRVFSNSDIVKLVSEDFGAAAEAIVTTLENLRNSQVIREACSFTFSRLVGVLGTRILPLIPRWIEGLLGDNSTKEEMSVFLRLLDQLIHGFKTEIFDYLNRLLSPLLGRVFSVLNQPTVGTDDELQTSELRKEYLNFFFVVLNNNLGQVFISELNQGNFDDFIQTIEYFAKDITDAPSQRIAFSLMIKMSQVWGGPEDPSTVVAPAPQPNQKKASVPAQPNGEHSEKLPNFDRFMIERFSGACWSVPANNSFNSQDAQAKLVLIEVASLQKTIYGRTGGSFISYLGDSYFPSINLPQQYSQEYLNALQTMDAKSFRKFFQSFVSKNVGGA